MTIQTKRTRRVANSIQKAIGETLLHQIRDPRIQRGGLVTISDVEVTKDLRHAKVYVSVSINDEIIKKGVLEGFNAAKAFIRSAIGKNLSLKRIPDLSFFIDETLNNAMKIEKILKEVSPTQDSGNPLSKQDEKGDEK